VDNEV